MHNDYFTVSVTDCPKSFFCSNVPLCLSTQILYILCAENRSDKSFKEVCPTGKLDNSWLNKLAVLWYSISLETICWILPCKNSTEVQRHLKSKFFYLWTCKQFL